MTFPRRAILLALAALVLGGCGTYQAAKGFVTGEPARVAPPPARETRWVLIKNPRFGATMAEPEYIWVEEDKIPTSLNTFLFGKKAVLAPQDLVAKYGPPPGNGKISPLQGGPPRVARAVASARPGAPRPPLADLGEPPVQEVTPRGYIVHVDGRRIVVDLTSLDGLRPGSILSLRREAIPITHPVTGERLGELDEEIGTARVIELREKFSVAELQEVRPGFELRVKDQVVVKQP